MIAMEIVLQPVNPVRKPKPNPPYKEEKTPLFAIQSILRIAVVICDQLLQNSVSTMLL